MAPPVFKTYSVGYGGSCEVTLDRKWADISLSRLRRVTL